MTNYEKYKGNPEEALARFSDFCSQFGCCSGCPFADKENDFDFDAEDIGTEEEGFEEDNSLMLCFAKWIMSEEKTTDLSNWSEK